MDQLLSYVTSEKDKIDGWFSRIDSQIFFEILHAQNRLSLDGGVAEIGLHHGKSFIALCLGLDKDQKAYGIDLFDNQSLNYDNSGKGEKTKVEQNIKSFGIESSKVFLDSRSSEQVNPKDIIESVGKIRFFSIDGGHWRAIVKNDLRLAEKVLADEGVIALDDFLRPEWPDVSFGFFDWHEDGQKTISPFAIGHNKLYLCHSNKVEFYTGLLLSSDFLKFFLSKHYNFLGKTIPVYNSFFLPEWRIRGYIEACFKYYKPDLYIKLRSLTSSRSARSSDQANHAQP